MSHSRSPTDRLLQIEEVLRRFPLLKTISLFPQGSANRDQRLPEFLGILLGTLQSQATGAVCVALPSKERVAFTTAVLAALCELEREFPLLAESLLQRNFRKGQLVRLSPEGYVFEYDGYFPHENGSFFRLKVPSSPDSATYGFPVKWAFRLSGTDRIGRRAPKKWTPEPAPETALDKLMGIEMRGNAAALSNHVLLLSSRSIISSLAMLTLIKLRNSPEGGLLPAPLSVVLSWGGIDDEGRLVTEGNGWAGAEPLIATTHSIERLAAACIASSQGSKLVIVDGNDRLRNPQALDDIRDRQRTLILTDHADAPELGILKERGVLVWAPSPKTVGIETISVEGRTPHPLLERFSLAARNATDLSLQVDCASSAELEAVALRLATLVGTLRNRDLDERVEELIGQCYGLLMRAAEWIVAPPNRIREAFEERVIRARKALRDLRFWFTEEARKEVELCIEELETIARLDPPGRGKMNQLMSILAQEDFTWKDMTVALVVRTPEYAAHLKEELDGLVPSLKVFPGAIPEGRTFELAIIGTWLSQHPMNKILHRYFAPSIRLILYSFERDWYMSFERRSIEWLRRFEPDSETLAKATGFDIWSKPSSGESRHEDHRDSITLGEDPITRFMLQRRRIRKGESESVGVPEDDLREARYVDFYGSSYAYLTDSHSVPVVTHLILGEEIEKVPLLTVRDLDMDDYVLFRDQGDQDIIALIAEAQMPAGRYSELCDTARSWRDALWSIGFTVKEIYGKLTNGGLTRKESTVRSWLRDEGKIGPGEDSDLHIIAEVSGNQDLGKDLSRVKQAIHDIRAAHIQAGFTLSRLLLNELPEKIPAIQQEGALVDLTFGTGWIVCVRNLSAEREDRAYWEVNRLLWEHGP